MTRRVLHVTDDNERILDDLFSPSPSRITRFSAGQVRSSDELLASHPLLPSEPTSSRRKKGVNNSSTSKIGLSCASSKSEDHNACSSATPVSNRSRSPSLGKSLLVAYDGFIFVDGDHHYAVPRNRAHAYELYTELRKCLQFLLPYVKSSSVVSSDTSLALEKKELQDKVEKSSTSFSEEELGEDELEHLGVALQRKRLRKEAKAVKNMSYSALREKLKELKLPFTGTKAILQSRLKKYYRHQLQGAESLCCYSEPPDTSSTAAAGMVKSTAPEGMKTGEKRCTQCEEAEEDLLLGATEGTSPCGAPACRTSLPVTTSSPLPAPPLATVAAGRLSALFDDDSVPRVSCPCSSHREDSASASDADSAAQPFRPSSVSLPFFSVAEGWGQDQGACQPESQRSSIAGSSTSMDVRERTSSRASSFLAWSNRDSHAPLCTRSESEENEWVTIQRRTSFRVDEAACNRREDPRPSTNDVSSSARSTSLALHSHSQRSMSKVNRREEQFLSCGPEAGKENSRVSQEAKDPFYEPQEAPFSYSSTDDNEDEEGISSAIWGSIKSAGSRILHSVVPLTPSRPAKNRKRDRHSID